VIGLVDTHCHVMDRAFDADRARVLANAREAGVSLLLLVGYDLATSKAAVSLARELGWARASVGIHPNAAAAHSDAQFAELARLAREPEVIAIGETGLDYYRQSTPHARQRQALEWHLDLAAELQLPVVIHNRQADADTEAALVERSAQHGVLHCFSSTDSRYQDHMLAAGYYISFAGPLTFKSADDLRGMARRVPSDRLLVETDCPYLAPMPHRGQRNEPAFVRFTAERLAEVRGVSFTTLVEQLWHNTVRVFPQLGLVPHEVA